MDAAGEYVPSLMSLQRSQNIEGTVKTQKACGM